MGTLSLENIQKAIAEQELKAHIEQGDMVIEDEKSLSKLKGFTLRYYSKFYIIFLWAT